jgi:hypothetical protein
MVLGWLTVLKAVPWTDVIHNAPVVVDGAKKLWSTVSRQPQKAATPAAASATSQPASALEGRIGALEATLADQHAQLVASSELIKALADQNAQLIHRIEALRRTLVWFGAAGALIALAAAWSLWLHWAR